MAPKPIALAAALVLACGNVPAAYRFEAPDVLDLSTDEHLAPLAVGAPLTPAPLAADAAQAILAAPEVGNDAPSQLLPLDGGDKQVRKQEAARVAPESAAVQRSGKTLSIKTGSGSVVFTDRQPPPRVDADQDGELFVYAGRVGAARYHRVEERFQQDAPAAYLVDPAGGKSLFVSNGSYIVQLSLDGKWLLSTSTGDSHLLLVLMALDADGPHLALLCKGGGSGRAGPGAFKGWHDATSFDLVLQPTPAGQQAPAESIPVRFALDAQGWHPATPDPRTFERLDYSCRR